MKKFPLEKIREYNETHYTDEQIMKAIEDYSPWSEWDDNFAEDIIIDAEIWLDVIHGK